MATIYAENKDKGLEVMWVLGSAETDQTPISLDYAKSYQSSKGLSIPILRDNNCLQVYGHMKSFTTSLPHQYVLDATTMELIHASGGVNQETEDKVFELLNK